MSDGKQFVTLLWCVNILERVASIVSRTHVNSQLVTLLRDILFSVLSTSVCVWWTNLQRWTNVGSDGGGSIGDFKLSC